MLQALRLHGKLEGLGRVRILVGEYAGPEYYAVEVLARCRGKDLTSCALPAYLFTHCPTDFAVADIVNPFRGTKPWHVEQALHKGNVKLSLDQCQLVKQIASSVGACTGVCAVAGAGKTVTVTGMVLCTYPYLRDSQRILWIVKARKMRDEQLDVFRQYLDNPLDAIAIGRSRGSAEQDDDAGEWDPMVADFLKAKIGESLQQLQTLREELNRTPANIDINSMDGRAWREKTERMHALSIQVYAAQQAAIAELFERARIIVMTVDGYVQLASGQAGNSGLLKKLEFATCVVDESHQLEFLLVAPVAARMRHMVFLWDQAQRMEFTRNCNAKGKDAVAKAGDFYSWERAIYGGSMTPVWTCMNSGATINLVWSWRFGAEICEFLRTTSQGYLSSTVISVCAITYIAVIRTGSSSCVCMV